MTQSSDKEKRFFLMCIDGSQDAETALNWYHKNLYKNGDQIGLVHVHICPNSQNVGFYGGGMATLAIYKEQMKKTVKESKDIMAKYEKICNEKGIPTKSYLSTNNHSIGQAVCNIAQEEGATHIVTGRRGLNFFRRTLMGSVSDYVLHHSHLPVTIVPSAKKQWKSLGFMVNEP